jgi:hypothetical protein
MAKSIDADAFARAYAEALPGHVDAMKAKAGIADLGDVGDTFCDGWDRIAGFLNMAVRALSLFRPREAAMAKAFLAAVRKTVVPMLCGRPAGEE